MCSCLPFGRRDRNDDGTITIGGLESEVLQESHYYPFGMAMDGNWVTQVGEKNRYLYNGKELEEDFGLNLSDYGARWYDASITRWGQVDPLASKFYRWSTYNYVYNNPLIYIDPDGMAGDLAKGITIIFKKGKGISNEQFGDYTMNYIMNVLDVWGDKGTGGKITFKFAIDDFDDSDLGKNENIVNYGSDPYKSNR